jgi:two-component system, chemotaxis family, response regulator Rcp1
MGGTRTLRLLVVEDSRSYIHLIQTAFQSRQGSIRWELTVVEDGDRALHFLFDEEIVNAPLPDLILLDWNLPKVNGSEVLEQIKDHRELRKIPVLVFSSSEADVDIHAAYHGHANGYITKPGSVNVLEEVIDSIEHFWGSVAKLPAAPGRARHAS